MTIQGSNSIFNKLIRDRQSLIRHIPNSLQQSMYIAWNNHYEELYESESTGTFLLEDALNSVLVSFEGSNQTLKQLRYVWMALTLAIVVEPTIKYYKPDNSTPEKTINSLTGWLIATLEEISEPTKESDRSFEDVVNITSTDIHQIFSEKNVSSFQVLSEALNVYVSAIRTLEENCSLKALLDILDDCLEGYAIFPGSYGRRELFNWWLLDVVPSCWYLLPPSSLYSLSEISEDNHQILNRLNKTSSLMWSFIYRKGDSLSNKLSIFKNEKKGIDSKTEYNEFSLSNI